MNVDACVPCDSIRDSSNPSRYHEKWSLWSCLSLMAFSIATGWSMPEFYDWTGADQSRPAPIVGWIAIGIVLLDAIAIGLLGWLHQTKRWLSVPRILHWQFSTKQLFVAIAITALLLVIGQSISFDVAFYVLHGFVSLILLLLSVRTPQTRMWIVTLLLCQSAPYVWILRNGSALAGTIGLLWMNACLPAFLPSMLVSALLKQQFDKMQWVATMLATIELTIGVWLIHHGQKRTIAYCLVVFTLSIFGSFVLHALMRA